MDELRRLVKEVSVGVTSPGGGMSVGSMMEPSPEGDNELSPQKQELENIEVILSSDPTLRGLRRWRNRQMRLT